MRFTAAIIRVLTTVLFVSAVAAAQPANLRHILVPPLFLPPSPSVWAVGLSGGYSRGIHTGFDHWSDYYFSGADKAGSGDGFNGGLCVERRWASRPGGSPLPVRSTSLVGHLLFESRPGSVEQATGDRGWNGLQRSDLRYDMFTADLLVKLLFSVSDDWYNGGIGVMAGPSFGYVADASESERYVRDDGEGYGVNKAVEGFARTRWGGVVGLSVEHWVGALDQTFIVGVWLDYGLSDATTTYENYEWMVHGLRVNLEWLVDMRTGRRGR